MSGYFTTVTLRTERTAHPSGGRVLYTLTTTWCSQRGLLHRLELLDVPTEEWASVLPPVFTPLDVVHGHNQALARADDLLDQETTRLIHAQAQAGA